MAETQNFNIEKIKQRIIEGWQLNHEQADFLTVAPLEKLCDAANEIRHHFCRDIFDFCTIFNGKCGACSEDCKFCAQSASSSAEIPKFPLTTDKQTLIKMAKHSRAKGILRFSVVTSGRGLTHKEATAMADNYRSISDSCDIYLCASHGLLNQQQLATFKTAGVKRIHCNLETSRNFFPLICTTHSYDDRVATIKAAQKLGFEVCSGGIFGLGETYKDRLDLAYELKRLGIKSIPINFLIPIKGTTFENIPLLPLCHARRIVAIYRFILPDAVIRIAAGRGRMADKGKSLFLSGANACISGDMLTTTGIHIDEDKQIIKKLGFKT